MTNLVKSPGYADIADKPSSNGIDCFFYVVDGIGCKVFKRECARDDSYRMQTILHFYGFAPAVGNCFDFAGPDGELRYGHTTEIAEIVGQADRDGDTLYGDIDDLKARMRDAGFDFRDDHSGNVGWVDGRMVCIDCTDVQHIKRRY